MTKPGQGQDADITPSDADAGARRIGRDLIRYDPAGALNHSLLYLGIGHDGTDGTLVLDHRGDLQLLWHHAPEQPILHAINAEMRGLTAVLGGIFIQTPRWHRSLSRNRLTLQPLGGCMMGHDAESGVVDHRGRVYDPSRGPKAVHEGLFVADGAVIPYG